MKNNSQGSPNPKKIRTLFHEICDTYSQKQTKENPINATEENICEQFENPSSVTEEKQSFDVNTLLSECNLENIKNNIENKTLSDINKEIYNAIDTLECFHLNDSSTLRSDKYFSFEIIQKKKELCKRMIGYQYICEINQLILGRSIKLIRIEDGKYYFAGVLLSIKFTNNGTIILCKIFPKGNTLNYNFDKYLIFQKLNKDEEMILSLQDFLQKT